VFGVAEYLLFQGAQFVGIFFTPIVWTGYIAAVDAAVYSMRGRSLINGHGRVFLGVLLVSAPLWLIFEAYNLRLQNWVYVGLALDPAIRYIGYAWAFSTIWPAMLETAYFFRAAGIGNREYAPIQIPAGIARAMPFVGAAMLVIPPVAPQWMSVYLFGMVWLGFIFLLDPINLRLGAVSLIEDLAQGQRARLYTLLLAGAVCGIFWEFWNYWAISKWIYVFPILQQAKIFEMPVPGYLGFPPFAVEYFVMWVFLAATVQRLIGKRLDYVPDF
jgi:hypothetical protein